MVDPLHSLFSSAPVQEWEQQTGLPPEAAAAQCCFKSKADVKAHLRYAHSCESEEISFVNDRLEGYLMRQGDGLVHRYVGSQLEGRVAPTEGHVRRYWLPTPTPTPASTPTSRLKPYAYP